MDYLTDNKILQTSEVSSSSMLQIQETFKTLLLQKKVKQRDLGYFLGLSKASISRIVNGKQIPELRLRLKIAEFFAVDTSLIWRVPIILPADALESKEVKENERSQNDYEAFEVSPSPELIALQTAVPRDCNIPICQKTEHNEAVPESTKGEPSQLRDTGEASDSSSSKTNGEEKT